MHEPDINSLSFSSFGCYRPTQLQSLDLIPFHFHVQCWCVLRSLLDLVTGGLQETVQRERKVRNLSSKK